MNLTKISGKPTLLLRIYGLEQTEDNPLVPLASPFFITKSVSDRRVRHRKIPQDWMARR